MNNDQSFEKLIQPLFEICMDARAERGIAPNAMAAAMIGAGRDALIAEAGPAVAATVLLAALDAIRQEHPDAVNLAMEAAAKSGKKSSEGLQ